MAWSQRWEDYYRDKGFDEGYIRSLERRQRQEDAQRQAAQQQSASQNDLLIRLRDELGLDVNFQDQYVQYGDEELRQAYNPFSGAYQVTGPDRRAQDAFFSYDPKAGYRFGGEQMGKFGYQAGFDNTKEWQQYDPRIALRLGDEDYAAADEWVKGIEDKVNAVINQGISSGAIAPSSRTVTEGTGYGAYRPGGIELAFGAEPSENQTKKRYAGINFNDSTIDQYLQRTDPETYRLYNLLSGSTGNRSYMQLAYENAADRLKDEYSGDYYQGLKDQFSTLESQLMTPEQRQQSQIEGIRNNPNLSEAVKNAILEKSFGITAEPAEDPMAAAFDQKQQELDRIKSMDADRKARMQESSVGKTFNQMGKEMVWTDKGFVTPEDWQAMNPNQPAQPTPQQPTPQVTQYAEALTGQESAPTLESTGGEIRKPWSADFEKQFLGILGNFSNNLTHYIGKGQAATPTTPKFSLKGFSRTAALGANTPVNSPSAIQGSGQTGVAPAKSYTGKAGQNKQSLWS